MEKRERMKNKGKDKEEERRVVQYSSQIGLEEIVNKGFMVVFTSSRTDNDSQKSLPKSDNRNRQKSRDRFATSDPYCFL